MHSRHTGEEHPDQLTRAFHEALRAGDAARMAADALRVARYLRSEYETQRATITDFEAPPGHAITYRMTDSTRFQVWHEYPNGPVGGQDGHWMSRDAASLGITPGTVFLSRHFRGIQPHDVAAADGIAELRHQDEGDVTVRVVLGTQDLRAGVGYVQIADLPANTPTYPPRESNPQS